MAKSQFPNQLKALESPSHSCSKCHTAFVTEVGLRQHVQAQHGIINKLDDISPSTLPEDITVDTEIPTQEITKLQKSPPGRLEAVRDNCEKTFKDQYSPEVHKENPHEQSAVISVP